MSKNYYYKIEKNTKIYLSGNNLSDSIDCCNINQLGIGDSLYILPLNNKFIHASKVGNIELKYRIHTAIILEINYKKIPKNIFYILKHPIRYIKNILNPQINNIIIQIIE